MEVLANPDFIILNLRNELYDSRSKTKILFENICSDREKSGRKPRDSNSEYFSIFSGTLKKAPKANRRPYRNSGITSKLIF